MWELRGQSIGMPVLKSLEPVDTFFEFESMRIFTVNDANVELMVGVEGVVSP